VPQICNKGKASEPAPPAQTSRLRNLGNGVKIDAAATEAGFTIRSLHLQNIF